MLCVIHSALGPFSTICSDAFSLYDDIAHESSAASPGRQKWPNFLAKSAVTSESEIWVNRRAYEQAELRTVIEQLLQENPRARATIQGDEEADIGVILDVQDLLLEMEVDVTISTLQE